MPGSATHLTSVQTAKYSTSELIPDLDLLRTSTDNSFLAGKAEFYDIVDIVDMPERQVIVNASAAWLGLGMSAADFYF